MAKFSSHTARIAGSYGILQINTELVSVSKYKHNKLTNKILRTPYTLVRTPMETMSNLLVKRSSTYLALFL
jgi:hypothetical protein